jgi:hypothetical protein
MTTRSSRRCTHEASQRAAERIPGARLVSLESGGHLMLGQTRIIRNELENRAAFAAQCLASTFILVLNCWLEVAGARNPRDATHCFARS